MLRMNMLKFSEVKEGDAGGAPAVVPPVVAPVAALDEFGYEKAPEKAAAPPLIEEEKPAAEKVEEIKDPASGYGKDPIVLKEEDPAAPPVEEKKIDLGYELETKDLEPGDAEKIKEFAKANGLTKEAAQAFVDLKKSENETLKKSISDFQKAEARKIAETKVAWDKELRTHPTFGGDKFDHNVMRAEKVLSEHLAETKKVLTDRKSMLPPYVMRDLAKLADVLYSVEKLVQGDPKSADKPDEKEFDHLDFYKV